jgi:hypothetical protein
MFIATCVICGKTYSSKPNWQKRGRKCCSMKCRNEAQKTGEFVKCHICGKAVWRTPRDFRDSESQQFFCGKHCQTIWRNHRYTGENHSNWKGGKASYRKRLLRTRRVRKCRVCDNNDERILTVHHKDKDRNNNCVENLEWLCCNCHFLEHNYK